MIHSDELWNAGLIGDHKKIMKLMRGLTDTTLFPKNLEVKILKTRPIENYYFILFINNFFKNYYAYNRYANSHMFLLTGSRELNMTFIGYKRSTNECIIYSYGKTVINEKLDGDGILKYRNIPGLDIHIKNEYSKYFLRIKRVLKYIGLENIWLVSKSLVNDREITGDELSEVIYN